MSSSGYESAVLEQDAQGEPENVYTDYFGFSSEDRFYFPDKRQWISFAKMNEGKKREFQKATSRDLRVQRTTGDALMKMDPGSERHELIKASITGWNLMRINPKRPGEWEVAPYNDSTIRNFLDGADPAIIEDLELAIRKANPWLMDDMSVEEIEREMDNLSELLKKKKEHEAGKSASVG